MIGPLIERVLAGGADDLDEILEVEDLCFTNPWTREMFLNELGNRDVSYIYAARTREFRVAGYCSFWLVLDELHINNLAVRPACRGEGLGTALLRRVLSEGRRLGARRATLEVRRSNEVARRLYERLRFHVAGTRPNYYSSPVEDALILWSEDLADRSGALETD